MEPQITTTIEAMRKQEENFYAVRGDYLMSHKHGDDMEDLSISVDYANRESMTEWSYKVIDFLGFGHETVEIATNYFDRFLLTPQGRDALRCPKLFQLANMACLYLSVKMNEEVVLDSKFMSNLSNGLFAYDEVERMELQVLVALQWLVNPPTAFAFIREYLQLLPPMVAKDMKTKTMALCEPQVQVSVMDYNFINVPASTVALLAVMNSLKVLGMDSILLSHVGSLLSYASRVMDIDTVREDIQLTLYEATRDCSSSILLTAAAASCGTGASTENNKSNTNKNKNNNNNNNTTKNTTTATNSTSAGCGVSTQEKMSQRATFNGSPCGVFS